MVVVFMGTVCRLFLIKNIFALVDIVMYIYMEHK